MTNRRPSTQAPALPRELLIPAVLAMLVAIGGATVLILILAGLIPSPVWLRTALAILVMIASLAWLFLGAIIRRYRQLGHVQDQPRHTTADRRRPMPLTVILTPAALAAIGAIGAIVAGLMHAQVIPTTRPITTTTAITTIIILSSALILARYVIWRRDRERANQRRHR